METCGCNPVGFLHPPVPQTNRSGGWLPRYPRYGEKLLDDQVLMQCKIRSLGIESTLTLAVSSSRIRIPACFPLRRLLLEGPLPACLSQPQPST